MSFIHHYGSQTGQLRFELFATHRSPGRGGGGGRGVDLPSDRLMRMCRWIGSHYHDWIDYNGVTSSIDLLEEGRTFSGFSAKKILVVVV